MRLDEYLKRAKKSPEQFAPELGLTGRSVRRYVDGDRFPGLHIIDRISKATGGKVTERDWLDQWRQVRGPFEHANVA